MKELFSAYWAFTKNMETGIQKYGLKSGNPKVLLYILNHEGCRQSDIAEDCFVSSATLSTVLSNMEKNGLIQRKRLDTDRRSYAISLTDKGRDIQKVIKHQIDATGESAFSDFSDKEIEELRNYLTRIKSNLSKQRDSSSV